MSAKNLVAGVDVGGTNIEVGLVDSHHRVIDRAKANTPTEGPDAVLSTIAELVSSFDADPVAVGVGIPGVVHDGDVLTVPNLSNWHEKVEIGDELGKSLGIPVALGNDANVGLLGEWLAGAADGADNVLGLWMGTGIGGALIIDGKPFNGSRGAAGEIGHVVVQERGALCGCGRRGCVEAYAGRRSMETAAADMVEAGRSTNLFDIRDDLGKTKITSKVWKKALDSGDELAVSLFDTAIDALGVAIGSTLNVLDLDLVVVGGGLAEKLGQDLADRIETATAPWVLQPNPDRRFAVSALGDDAGIVGAASLGRALL
ncbi:ROK family protein [Williamsia sp.]|uniref:ROK family protein n=1 Tax=Williamsia sp. TaxID=1872085 RepID=UPI001A1DB195|nr:ROK family protein [Williamsia sp.]MBJ7288045.1 ROK family protein [Williamsia sp.]